MPRKPQPAVDPARTLKGGKVWKGTIYGPGDEHKLPADFPDGPWWDDYVSEDELAGMKDSVEDIASGNLAHAHVNPAAHEMERGTAKPQATYTERKSGKTHPGAGVPALTEKPTTRKRGKRGHS